MPESRLEYSDPFTGSDGAGAGLTTAGSGRELYRAAGDGFTFGFTSSCPGLLGILLITLEGLSASRVLPFVAARLFVLRFEKLALPDKCIGPDTAGFVGLVLPLSCPRCPAAKREYKGVSALPNGAGEETTGLDDESSEGFLSRKSRFMNVRWYREWLLRGR